MCDEVVVEVFPPRPVAMTEEVPGPIPTARI